MNNCLVTKLNEEINASELPVFQPKVAIFTGEISTHPGIIDRSKLSKDVYTGEVLTLEINAPQDGHWYDYLEDETYVQHIIPAGEQVVYYTVRENFKYFKTWFDITTQMKFDVYANE